MPGGQLLGIVAVVRIARQMRARAQLLHDLRKAVLGNGEQHGDRLKLGDHDHAVGVGGVDDIAGIHQAQPQDTRDRAP